jgi:hypothetical protein
MNIQWQDGDVLFGDLDEFLSELFLRLPEFAGAEDEAARKRLYGGATGGADPEADSEWHEVVEPELRELFQSHIDVVSADLKLMENKDDLHVLRVPGEHLDAWVHTLNQARLALGARHDVTEEDMEGHREIDGPEKGFALFQIEIYGLVLSFLLRHMEP